MKHERTFTGCRNLDERRVDVKNWTLPLSRDEDKVHSLIITSEQTINNALRWLGWCRPPENWHHRFCSPSWVGVNKSANWALHKQDVSYDRSEDTPRVRRERAVRYNTAVSIKVSVPRGLELFSSCRGGRSYFLELNFTGNRFSQNSAPWLKLVTWKRWLTGDFVKEELGTLGALLFSMAFFFLLLLLLFSS